MKITSENLMEFIMGLEFIPHEEGEPPRVSSVLKSPVETWFIVRLWDSRLEIRVPLPASNPEVALEALEKVTVVGFLHANDVKFNSAEEVVYAHDDDAFLIFLKGAIGRAICHVLHPGKGNAVWKAYVLKGEAGVKECLSE